MNISGEGCKNTFDSINVDKLCVDGYCLPESAGTEGQVITMNADGKTTDFKDTFEATARIVVNKFTALTTNNTNDFGNFRVIENTFVGSKEFSASEWTVGSEIRIKVVGYWNYQRADFPIFPTGIFGITVGDANFPPIAPIELYNVQATNDYTGPTFPQTVDNEGYFNLDVSLVKLNNTQYSLRANLANSRQIINNFSYTGIITPDKLNNHPVTLGGAAVDPFFCQIEWQDNTAQSSGLSYLRPSINRYEIDLVNSEGSIVGTTAAPATDHNTLANLTVGDVHTQYTKLNGRSGGQILSGGILPIHNLTLKSHDIGLPNVIVRDLNTTFEKNIDMNQNQIDNCLVLNNQSGPLNLIGGSGVSAVLIDPTPTQGIIIGCNVGASTEITGDTELSLISNIGNIECNPFNQFNVNVSGLPRLSVNATETNITNNLNMNNNDIINVTRIEGNTGQDMVLYSDDGITVAARDPLIINALDGDGIICQTSSNTRMVITSSEVDVREPINMNSNDIINVSEVNNTSNLKLSSVGGLLDIDSNLIQFTSTAIPQGQIDAVGGWEIFNNLSMTNNNINNVNALGANQVNTDTIENSGSGFLSFTNLGSYIPSFTPSGLDMNDGELLSVNNIRTNIQPILTINKNGSNATEIYGNSTIRRIQVSNAVYLLPGTNLECGTNDINDAGNVNISGSNNITIPVVVGTPSGALQVQNGGAYIKQDLQVDGSIYCDSINNIRPSGGLYSESSGFNIPSTNLTETNLLGQGGSAGTLAIPANTFSQFDSYSFKASGVLSGGSNDTATLRLKSLVNGTTPVELGSIVIQLTDNGLVDVAWKVEADFNVRTLGGAGVGVLVLSGNFAYTNNNDILKTYLRTIVNNTVFDTTQSNELQFTYENDAVNPLTNIRIDQASFTKWY